MVLWRISCLSAQVESSEQVSINQPVEWTVWVRNDDPWVRSTRGHTGKG